MKNKIFYTFLIILIIIVWIKLGINLELFKNTNKQGVIYVR